MITQLLENNLLPDSVIRFGIQRLLKQRIQDESCRDQESQWEKHRQFIAELSTGPIAEKTQEANEQHYEVPTEFYLKVLGPYLKYSSGLWNKGTTELASAEKDMLELYFDRAEISNNQNILDLGCGWGSFSLYAAEIFPGSTFTAVSNSTTQRRFIESRIEEKGLNNLTVKTCDINELTFDQKFDRVVSIEMFEHMRNYKELLRKISTWLNPTGKLFVHIFTHKELGYYFDVKDETDWMSKYFFSGGIMPSDHQLFYFNDHLRVTDHWRVSGTHYEKTSLAWLENMDKNKSTLFPLFEKTYEKKEAMKWWSYWRVFFLSCATLWGHNGGNDWFVSHYLLSPLKDS